MIASKIIRRLGFSLWILCAVALGVEAQTKKPGVQVELSKNDDSRLHVAIRSLASAPAEIFKLDLPWEQRDRIILTAVTTSGIPVPLEALAGDPLLGSITIDPGQSTSGEIDLHTVFKGFDEVRKESDVILFWAYRSPDGLNLPKWSGGWILIPRKQ